MKSTLALIAAALLAISAHADCSGSNCQGGKGKLEALPTAQQVQP